MSDFRLAEKIGHLAYQLNLIEHDQKELEKVFTDKNLGDWCFDLATLARLSREFFYYACAHWELEEENLLREIYLQCLQTDEEYLTRASFELGREEIIIKLKSIQLGLTSRREHVFSRVG